MTFLLDTNVVSELRKSGTTGDVNVARWAASVSSEALFLSVMTLFELEVGIRRVERLDARQGSRLRVWLERSVLQAFENRILPVTSNIAIACSALHVPNKRPIVDSLIAATAIVHDMRSQHGTSLISTV